MSISRRHLFGLLAGAAATPMLAAAKPLRTIVNVPPSPLMSASTTADWFTFRLMPDARYRDFGVTRMLVAEDVIRDLTYAKAV